jgi:hypothetical protein
MDEKLKQWRADGHHLPKVLRDFHDQKEVFKAMHDMLIVKPSDIGSEISVVEGQVYVVDRFLWFMARHGYTLQKSRARQNFDSLEGNVQSFTEQRNAAFAKLLGLTPVPPKDPDPVDANSPA